MRRKFVVAPFSFPYLSHILCACRWGRFEKFELMDRRKAKCSLAAGYTGCSLWQAPLRQRTRPAVGGQPC